MLTVIVYKLYLNKKRKNGRMGKGGEWDTGLWQVRTVVSSYSKQAGYGDTILSIRGIQAMFAQAQQVALARE